MPMINIKFDDSKVSDTDIEILSTAVQDIVTKSTGIKDVFVYADSPRIKLKVAPIEIFIEMSASEIQDKNKLFLEVKTKLSEWKKAESFSQPINLTLTPMDWKFEVDI